MINWSRNHLKSGAPGGVSLVLLWVLLLPGVCAQPLLPDEFDEGRRAYDAGFFDEAYLLWLPMAGAGDPRAQFALGTLYFEGAGVKQGFELSTYWYRLAADQGLPAAQYNVGMSYRYGYGVDQNNLTAIYWWQLASEQGLASASFNIGNQYMYGRGVARDEEEGYEWYRKAADQGHPRAAKMFTDRGEIVRSEVARPGSESVSIADSVEPTDYSPQQQLAEASSDNTTPVLTPEQAEPGNVSPPETQQQTTLIGDSDPESIANPVVSATKEAESRQEPITTLGSSTSLDSAPKPERETQRPVAVASAEPAQQSILYGSDWLLAHNPDHYTVQLAAMTEEARVSRFISRHQIKGEMAYFQFERDGQVLYALVMGVYPDQSAANAAISGLPERVQAGTPWPRLIGRIQELIEP